MNQPFVPDLGRLRVLRELHHRGTLARVAEALSYSPSTISQQLSQLERETGTSLLQPDGRGVRLTPQAEILVGHVERILTILDQAEADIATSLTDLTGTIRVAAFQTAAVHLLPAAVEHLAVEHPNLHVQVALLEPEKSLPMLRIRDFDLVLTEDYPGQSAPPAGDLDLAPLTRDPLYLVLPAGDTRTLTDLTDAVWVMEPAGTPARQWAETLCRQAGYDPDVRFEATDLRFHLDLVRRGQCAALLPQLALTAAPTGLTASALPGHPARTIRAVVRTGSTSHPAITALRNALTRTCANDT